MAKKGALPLKVKMIGAAIVVLGILAGCGASASAPADDHAKEAAKAIIDKDYEAIFNLATEGYQKHLLENDPTLQDESAEEIADMEVFDAGDYEEMIKDDDYIIGAHYGFLEEENYVLYYVEGYAKGMRREFFFMLTKEGKLVNYQHWPPSVVGNRSDKLAQEILNKKDETAILEKGGSYEGDS